MTKGDLLHLTLIASDNAAARALARVSPYGSAGFIDRMNEKAKDLGLTNTHYEDPSGLLAANVSSAYDMASSITFVSGDERIAGVMRKQNYRLAAGRRMINIHSTNQLVMRGDVDVQAGKTGFIHNAGYCLATLLQLPQGPQIAVVVLGAKSNAGRFWETRHLFNWFSTKAQDLLGVAPVEASELQARHRELVPQGRRHASPFPLGRISALHCRRIERQCGDAVDHRHHRPGRAAAVVHLQIPMAHIARVDAILAVSRRKRRDARPIAVAAVGTGQRLELPSQRASSANQVTFG